MKPVILGMLVIVLASNFAGQSNGNSKKPIPRKKPQQSAFICPDAEAKQACDSYAELIRAKDSGIVDQLDDAYVCFRKNSDQFFVIAYSKPIFERVWNAKLKQMVIDNKSRSDGSGYAASYKNGIESSTVVPSFFFSGHWFPFPQPGAFVSDEVNFEKQKPGELAAVSINEAQLSIHYEYQNTSDVAVVYDLTIQRSTLRYGEQFQEKGKPLSSVESTGRCVFQRAGF